MLAEELVREPHATAEQIVAEICLKSPRIGANRALWPGLTSYRLPAPVGPQWDYARSLALCFVAQGCTRVIIERHEYVLKPFHCLLLARGQRFQTEILAAQQDSPFLALVLRVAPAMVRELRAEELGDSHVPVRPQDSQSTTPALASEADGDLASAIARFLPSTSRTPDKDLLAPLYQREIVYRLLHSEQRAHLLAASALEHESNPVSAAIRHVRAQLPESAKITDLATLTGMSQSTFARQFRNATGLSPHQFIKRMRLDHARELLVETDNSVETIAHAIGYACTSRFIADFKSHFEATPRQYAESQRHSILLDIGKATAPQW